MQNSNLLETTVVVIPITSSLGTANYPDGYNFNNCYILATNIYFDELGHLIHTGEGVESSSFQRMCARTTPDAVTFYNTNSAHYNKATAYVTLLKRPWR